MTLAMPIMVHGVSGVPEGAVRVMPAEWAAHQHIVLDILDVTAQRVIYDMDEVRAWPHIYRGLYDVDEGGWVVNSINVFYVNAPGIVVPINHNFWTLPFFGDMNEQIHENITFIEDDDGIVQRASGYLQLTEPGIYLSSNWNNGTFFILVVEGDTTPDVTEATPEGAVRVTPQQELGNDWAFDIIGVTNQRTINCRYELQEWQRYNEWGDYLGHYWYINYWSGYRQRIGSALVIYVDAPAILIPVVSTPTALRKPSFWDELEDYGILTTIEHEGANIFDISGYFTFVEPGIYHIAFESRGTSEEDTIFPFFYLVVQGDTTPDVTPQPTPPEEPPVQPEQPPTPPAEITVLVNNTPLVMDTPPIIINDRTMVPVRAIADALGINISWNGETSEVTLYHPDEGVAIMTIGSTTVNVIYQPESDREITLDVAATISNDRTLVPLRFFGDFLGATVGWDAATRTASITS